MRKSNQRWTLLMRLRSFECALRGIYRLFVAEPNMWIHGLASIVVFCVGFYLKIKIDDWCWIALAVGGVWSAEAFNSALERTADAVMPNYHPLIRDAKDMAAAGVLCVSLTATVIGIFRLFPYVYHLCNS